MIQPRTRHRLSYAFVDGEAIPFDRSVRSREDVIREYRSNQSTPAPSRDHATIAAMLSDNPGNLVVVCRTTKDVTIAAYLYPVKKLTARSIPTALESLSLPPRTASVVFAHRDTFTTDIQREATAYVQNPAINLRIAEFRQVR